MYVCMYAFYVVPSCRQIVVRLQMCAWPCFFLKDEDKKPGAGFDAVAANGAANKNLAGDLFTSQGLQASYSDLDQIFDNSDDTSSDETVIIR